METSRTLFKKKGFYHDNTDIIGHMMVVSLTDNFSTVCLILHGDSQMAKVRCDQTAERAKAYLQCNF